MNDSLATPAGNIFQEDEEDNKESWHLHKVLRWVELKDCLKSNLGAHGSGVFDKWSLRLRSVSSLTRFKPAYLLISIYLPFSTLHYSQLFYIFIWSPFNCFGPSIDVGQGCFVVMTTQLVFVVAGQTFCLLNKVTFKATKVNEHEFGGW